MMETLNDWTNNLSTNSVNTIAIGSWSLSVENENLVVKYNDEIKMSISPDGTLRSKGDIVCNCEKPKIEMDISDLFSFYNEHR